MQATYIEVSAGVRYWEDATINGATDTDGTLTPMHDKGWDCAALKPYPVREEDKPWAQLCARWNDA